MVRERTIKVLDPVEISLQRYDMLINGVLQNIYRSIHASTNNVDCGSCLMLQMAVTSQLGKYTWLVK